MNAFMEGKGQLILMAANNSESLVMTPPPHHTPDSDTASRSSFRLAFGLLFCGRSARSCVTLGMIVNHGIIVDVTYCAARTGQLAFDVPLRSIYVSVLTF